MKIKNRFWPALLAFATTFTAAAQVPGIIQYQGRVTSNGTNFTGTGQFKFALIENPPSGPMVWNNAGLANNLEEPINSVPVSVDDGLFIVGLGDTKLTNMMTIKPSIFTNQQLVLRIWFSDGVGSFAALSPDQVITTVGFAMMAADFPNGTVTTAKLADGAVTAGKMGTNSVAGLNVLDRSLAGVKLITNTITSAEIADTLLLQRLDLGGPLWNGTFSLNSAGANEPRSLLVGDAVGSQFHLQFGNNSTGVVLSARSPGGRLSLSDYSAREAVRLATPGIGGELTLYQTAGTWGAFLDGQASTGGGELRLREATGIHSTVELVGAETDTTGAELRLRRANGTATVVIDAENDAQGGPRIDLSTGDGTSTLAIVPGGGDVTLGGGGIMRLGEIVGSNLGIDGNQILARTNGAPGPLFLNYYSGAVVHTARLTVNTSTPATGYSVSVNGKVICEELVVQDSADWPDYVFADGYILQSLEEVEASIQKDKHLPGIPSAKKIGEDGIPLGQVQKQIMMKIEELTLHLIQQNKRLQAQELELSQLRSRLDAAK